MEIFRFKDKELQNMSIACETWSTSQAWGHRAVLIHNGRSMLETKVRYYNRTWEMYTYQTCMRKLVNMFYEENLKAHYEGYKLRYDIVRFKKGEKEKIEADFKNSKGGKTIQKMLDVIETRDFIREY